MDCERFDRLTRHIGSVVSRRAAVVALLGVVLPGVVPEVTDAKNRDKRFRRRVKRRIRRLWREISPPVTPEPICQGSDGCGTDRCGPNNACFCRIAQETGVAFCGGTAYDVLNCSQCGAGTVCVNLLACGAIGCAPVCSGEAL